MNLQRTIQNIDLTHLMFIGMLSKSKGQILRVAANMHVFFGDKLNDDNSITIEKIPSELSEAVISAAQNYVETCCQHAAYIGGRGDIEEEIKLVSTSKWCLCCH